jgi:hypothetical protein
MAPSTKVIVCSKLPMSLVLKHPLKPTNTVLIKGTNAAPKGTNGVPMFVPYMTTEVNAEFWNEWFLVHNHATKPFAPLASGAIFAEKTADAVASVAKEHEGEKTGMEPTDPKAFGVKALDKKDE